jgi:(2Fe-2S) ferredoxin
MNDKLRKRIEKLGIPDMQRHIMLCCDTDECGCASKKQMKSAWKHLRQRLRERGLTGRGGVFRSKAYCFDICKDAGPIAVVYPEGTWYGGCTPEVLDRIVDEHLAKGQVVQEHLLARSPMTDGRIKSKQ